MIRAEVYLANSGIEGLVEELIILVPVIEEPGGRLRVLQRVSSLVGELRQ